MRLPDGKRVMDLALTVPVFVLTLPLQATVALLVSRKLGRPVFFEQRRPGLHGQPFTLRKFRTMLPVDEGLGRTDDESRMTEFGRILRSTSLDELPTLWNVIRGDMSLVGPRPLLMSYLERYTPEQARRHEVRPGLTGLAQVSGRNSISWEEKFLLDTHYARNRSTWLDIVILCRTLACVVTRRGITAADSVTMPEFLGSRTDEEMLK